MEKISASPWFWECMISKCKQGRNPYILFSPSWNALLWLVFLLGNLFVLSEIQKFFLKGNGLGARVTSGHNLFAQLWSNSGFLCEQVTNCSFPLTCDPTVALETHCDTVTWNRGLCLTFSLSLLLTVEVKADHTREHIPESCHAQD